MANLSKEKRTFLLKSLNEIRSGLSEDYLRVALNEIEVELIDKKYGIVWENHSEKVNEELESSIPVFVESKERELLSDAHLPVNFLIEGDNLHSLKLLLKTHRGEIDLIYIDPPYNTGNEDFIYEDKYIDKTDSFRHSKWISFMAERLSIAQKLLSPQGVIFIQISDIELAQLKMLCDEIFDENNYVNILSVNMKNNAGASGGGEDKRFKKNCEYILIYAKDYSMLPMFSGPYIYTEISDMIQQYLDEGVSWKYTSVLVDAGEKEFYGITYDGDEKEIKVYLRKNPRFMSIQQIANRDGISKKEAYKKYGNAVFRTTNSQSSIRTRIQNYCAENSINENLISIEYVPKTGKNKACVYEQFYKDSGKSCNLVVWLRDTSEEIDGELYKKDLQGTYWDMTPYTKNLSKEGNIVFSNGKKPVELIKQIISIYPKKDALVLDFFAGSGTTGHAVIALNNEEKQIAVENNENQNLVGNRSFILCTNNEVNSKQKLAYLHFKGMLTDYIPKAADTNATVGNKIKKYFEDKQDEYILLFEEQSSEVEEYGICRYFTYPRLRNVICGYTNEDGRTFEPVPANLKYYLTHFIDKGIDDELSERLLNHVREMVQLEFGIYIDDIRFQIVLSDDSLDSLMSNEKNLDKCLILFYLSSILFTANQKRLIDEHDIKLIPIPEHYFDNELREEGEY